MKKRNNNKNKNNNKEQKSLRISNFMYRKSMELPHNLTLTQTSNKPISLFIEQIRNQ